MHWMYLRRVCKLFYYLVFLTTSKNIKLLSSTDNSHCQEFSMNIKYDVIHLLMLWDSKIPRMRTIPIFFFSTKKDLIATAYESVVNAWPKHGRKFQSWLLKMLHKCVVCLSPWECEDCRSVLFCCSFSTWG